MSRGLKFIDLFAGIGGFHIALNRLGHDCVFASELSSELRILYEENYGLACHGDITKIDVDAIPEHDILCAGFPCQTFSKAGNQNGMKEARGKLFDEILKILKYHRPRYFILENVRNLLSHDSGKTWSYISEKLEDLEYFFDKRILSPHLINIPQHRERIFIVGSLQSDDIENLHWLEKEEYTNNVDSILSHSENEPNLEPEKISVLNTWAEFLNGLPKEIEPYRPLWSMEFQANYPTDVNWESMSLKEWQKYRGMFGFPLSRCHSLESIYDKLPNYVKTQKGIPPLWKQKFINNNRAFFEKNTDFISIDVLDKIKNFRSESWKKLEWNCPNTERTFEDKLIQFRGSGVRIKKNDYLPSLVTVSTQVPVIGKYMRYILPQEGSRVQSLPLTINLPKTKAGSFRVLGNMVNIELVYRVATQLLKNSSETDSILNQQLLVKV